MHLIDIKLYNPLEVKSNITKEIFNVNRFIKDKKKKKFVMALIKYKYALSK